MVSCMVKHVIHKCVSIQIVDETFVAREVDNLP